MKKNDYKKGILIAFGELFLKSEGVKNIFQRRLVRNLEFFLRKKRIDFKIYSFRERIFLETEQTGEAAKTLKRVFGAVWSAQSFYFPETSLKEFSGFIKENYQKWIKRNETFAIRLKIDPHYQIFGAGARKGKEKIIEEVAKKIERKVDLGKPKKEIFVEIRKRGWFLYFKKKKGAGGFPVGASGKVLSLISGGIDSPVAAYFAAKRGAENIWLHFHSFPLVSRASIEKVKELAKIFLKYQPRLKIYFVPFQKAQVEIKTKAPAKYRILLYRRLMFKIAERIAKKENCQALVTGESLGQVSSQTLPNLKIIGEATKIPVLRPLIGFDKEEIINMAKRIGTFRVSIKPQEDCCTLFVPRHQTAQGKIETIKELEKKIKSGKIIQECIKEAEIGEYWACPPKF